MKKTNIILALLMCWYSIYAQTIPSTLQFDGDTNTIYKTTPENSDELTENSILLHVKVFLEGPYFYNQMTPFINLFGYIPLMQPYNNEPWFFHGVESVTSIPSPDIIDWVLVELVQAVDSLNPDSFIVLSSRAGFLLSDGTITDIDGMSNLSFPIQNIDEFHVRIIHRNHLPVVSAQPLSKIDEVFTYDFTSNPEKAIGGKYAQKKMTDESWAMIAANGYADNIIDNKDKNEVWILQLYTMGYNNGDFNMDGQVDEVDKAMKWSNNLGRGIHLSFIPAFNCGEVFTDKRDGQTYSTVKIADQCWIAQNLNIGIQINGADSQTDNGIIEKYCYNNVPSNCENFGGLYQWDELMKFETDSATQGICPTGWHIPTDFEWKLLEGSVDSQYGVGHSEWDGISWRGFDAGKNLKSVSGWNNGGNGSNTFGLNILPAGRNDENGYYFDLGGFSYFHSSTQYNSENVWRREFKAGIDLIRRQYNSKNYGFSVRCLHD